MARVSSSTVRSGPSRKTCYLRFVNNTSRKINVIWIDYSGGNRNYGTLEPHRHFDIHSYEGHPWISEDSVSKQRMLLNKLEVFYPKPILNRPNSLRSVPWGSQRCYMPVLSSNEFNNSRIKREYVFITLPVFSLMEISAEVIIRRIRNRGDIRSLELPKRMQAMLTNSYFRH